MRIDKEYYDVVVIGAGIHGAGVAQAAAAKGYSVLLLEQYKEPAQGTSSRSSKLIHGGLRYLESAEFHLVSECLRERKRLLKNAPDLVSLRDFYIPVYRQSKRPAWIIRAGLFLYALLSGFDRDNRFQSIPSSEWPLLDGINQNQLTHVFRYHDAQTHDAKLTSVVLESAVFLGAELKYAAKFENATRCHAGYEIAYRFKSKKHMCTGGVLINAAGPWVNQVLERIEPKPGHLNINLVQGTHLLLPGCISKGIYYLEAPSDGRAVFVMPWMRNKDETCVMIGTTETLYQGDPAEVHPREEEVQYLLDIFNEYFPGFSSSGGDLRQSDILESFAGLRVLLDDKRNPFRRSRETQFTFDDALNPRLLSIYGGKLTSFRATAEKVVQQLSRQLPKRRQKADTATLRLTKF